ncbi:MAG: efflux RND transporter permease subunit, partial [Firmicutes bacterium]|nr:efflux RND transporter permease subunit [Bacillota bacterium]
MRLPHLAVRRPVTIWMGILIIVILGVVSVSRLPIELLPSIEVPVLAVVTTYEGAGPFEVETMISRPLEEVMGAVNGITNIASTSSRGTSVVTLEFDWDTDMDMASLDVREKVDLIKGVLPEDADSPIVMKFSLDSMPVMQLVLHGDRPGHELRRIAEQVIKNRLERLDGVASVEVSGGQGREIQVILHPGLLQTYGISVTSVVQALQAANLNLPAGQITERGLDYIVRTTGEFTNVAEIEEVRVPSSRGGLVRLADIAIVKDTYQDADQLSRHNGSPSVSLSIQKEAGANTVQVAERVHREVQAIEAELVGLELVAINDTSEFISLSIRGIVESALNGAVLAILILLVFLGSIQSTLVIGIAIPVSIVATFILVYFSNTTLNMVSMGGLALGVGMLVDNAIVVLENIYRHQQEEGKEPKVAAAEGAEEVGTAISASTLTTIAVFLPVVFIAGLAREIFKDLALTVTFSLLASLGVALTIVPSVAARLLSTKDTGRTKKSWLQRFFNKLQAGYNQVILWALRHRGIVIAATLVTFIGSLALVPSIGMEFMPEMDEGTINVMVSMPKGTKLEDTDRIAALLEDYAQGIQEVDGVFVSIGAESASLYITLVPLEDRERSSFEVGEELRQYASRLPGAEISVYSVSTMMGFGAPIQVKLKGDDLALLESSAQRIKAAIEQIPGTREVSTSLEDTVPEFRIIVDREKAASHGLSIAQIASTVRTAVSGQTATRYRSGGREIDVVVRFQDQWRGDTADLRSIPIQTTQGGQVPLGEVASLELATSPVQVQREGRTRVVSVSGQIMGTDLGTVMQQVSSLIEDMDLPDGVLVEFGGQDQLMTEAFQQLALALVLGIVLVFMVMAAQFESLLQPFAIMFTMPLAFIGVVGGLWIGNLSLNVPGLIGIILLAGIVVNNGIVL